MDEVTKTIHDYYNASVMTEWNRIAGRPEFLLTRRMLDRYISPENKVLDIGGGPGRYSLYLAQKGCDVTLFDLSPENIKFADERANEYGLKIKTFSGDAREVDNYIKEQFDHILLMGPMYHLLEEIDRINVVNAAIKLLKPNGVLFVSFINLIAGMIFSMKTAPELIASTVPSEVEYRENFIAKKSFAGDAFTKAFFIEQNEIIPFMAQFPLEKLHLFGQESITPPCEGNIMAQPKEIVDAWLNVCERICEREDLFSWSEHLMYVGRKK
jgi:2-polyprenyl-3-methyl-5-hydroxy-6-metoxy-1,4-benzoquinol methylase